MPKDEDNGQVRAGDPKTIPKTHTGIIPLKLFEKAQQKVEKRALAKRGRKAKYPLSDIIYCTHCGRPLHGSARKTKTDRGKRVYVYPAEYVCQTYNAYGAAPRPHNETCGRHAIKADAVLAVVADRLRQYYLGTGRAELIEETKRQLKAERQNGGSDAKRLEKRAKELDAEIKNLVKAVRLAPDVPEVIQELKDARGERDRIKSELKRTGRSQVSDIDEEAEAIANELWRLFEVFKEADLVEIRELMQVICDRVDCTWEPYRTPTGKTRYRLAKGEIVVKSGLPLFCGNGAHLPA
ncbi:MAG: recombinase zinc beta ribbon domain-containing protein [Planctomycetota bacterium]